jgi:hypothetical protein
MCYCQDAVGDIDWSSVEFSTVELRQLKRHRAWGLGVCLRLSMPLALCGLLFAAIYLHMDAVTQHTYSSSLLAHAMGERTVNVNVNELRLGFSNTTRNPEGILSHNNRQS